MVIPNTLQQKFLCNSRDRDSVSEATIVNPLFIPLSPKKALMLLLIPDENEYDNL